MCSTKPKFITLLYFIFIIAYKLLVRRSCMIGLEWLWLSLKQREKAGPHHQSSSAPLWNNHLNCCSIVQFLDRIRLPRVAGIAGPIFHWIFHRLPEEAYPRIIMYNLATTNPIQSDKILPFLGYDSMFTFDVFRFKTNNNKISSSCQIFSKAFLETDEYAGFCGILHLKPSQNLQQ